MKTLVKDDNLIKIRFLSEIVNGGGGASSWGDIQDKPFEAIGQNLTVVGGALSVITTDVAEQDNTKPITSAGAHVILGNINSLLENI